MNFYENYISMCIEFGKSPSGAAQEMGIARQSVSRWKKGSIPTDENLMKIARYFGKTFTEMKALAQ